jgi:hypothetical protein
MRKFAIDSFLTQRRNGRKDGKGILEFFYPKYFFPIKTPGKKFPKKLRGLCVLCVFALKDRSVPARRRRFTREQLLTAVAEVLK